MDSRGHVTTLKASDWGNIVCVPAIQVKFL